MLMIDMLFVEHVLVCVVMFLFVAIMALGVVYLGASVLMHVYDVKRTIEHLRSK